MDTIAAIATPGGSGGIGIIRISGPNALNVIRALFKKSNKFKSLIFPEPLSHRMYHGRIIEPYTQKVLDEVMMVFMQAPRSYTCEDVVEIQAHSGPAVLRTILDLVFKQGVRLAEPGEFTKRAFLNGRIDLTQAEAVADMINAHTDQSLTMAASQVQGHLKNQIKTVRAAILAILAQTEAAIDFPEDVGEDIDTENILNGLENQIIAPLKYLAGQYDNAHILRDGLKLVVAGRPNVGKSSLMNRLLKKERAIVTEIPGTTRDTIEESLIIQGVPIVMTDTAGLHDTHDPVEKIGIERARERIEAADVILFMTDASVPLAKADHAIYQSIAHKQVIWIINKSDLVSDIFLPDIPELWINLPTVRISAKYDQGIDQLKQMIADLAVKGGLCLESPVVPNLRHKKAIDAALNALKTAKIGIQNNLPFELVNIDVLEAFDRLGEIIGVSIREDVLDEIFSNFCIGK